MTRRDEVHVGFDLILSIGEPADLVLSVAPATTGRRAEGRAAPRCSAKAWRSSLDSCLPSTARASAGPGPLGSAVHLVCRTRCPAERNGSAASAARWSCSPISDRAGSARRTAWPDWPTPSSVASPAVGLAPKRWSPGSGNGCPTSAARAVRSTRRWTPCCPVKASAATTRTSSSRWRGRSSCPRASPSVYAPGTQPDGLPCRCRDPRGRRLVRLRRAPDSPRGLNGADRHRTRRSGHGVPVGVRGPCRPGRAHRARVHGRCSRPGRPCSPGLPRLT